MSLKNIHNLNQEEDDDEEDEDYVPAKADSESEEEEKNSKKAAKRKKEEFDDDEVSDSDNDEESKSNSKTKKCDEIEPMKEEDKKKADELWSSFLKDVKTTSSKQTSNLSNANKYQTINQNKHVQAQKTQSNKTDFFNSYTTEASKKDSVSNEQKKDEIQLKKAKPSGMASILERLNKEPKTSTLQKSKLDWEEFKKEEKIEEDLSILSKSKQSYLDRQAFLDRTDLRQFEIEKDLRNKERKQRDAKF